MGNKNFAATHGQQADGSRSSGRPAERRNIVKQGGNEHEAAGISLISTVGLLGSTAMPIFTNVAIAQDQRRASGGIADLGVTGTAQNSRRGRRPARSASTSRVPCRSVHSLADRDAAVDKEPRAVIPPNLAESFEVAEDGLHHIPFKLRSDVVLSPSARRRPRPT